MDVLEVLVDEMKRRETASERYETWYKIEAKY